MTSTKAFLLGFVTASALASGAIPLASLAQASTKQGVDVVSVCTRVSSKAPAIISLRQQLANALCAIAETSGQYTTGDCSTAFIATGRQRFEEDRTWLDSEGIEHTMLGVRVCSDIAFPVSMTLGEPQ